jgi:hypothetical protein
VLWLPFTTSHLFSIQLLPHSQVLPLLPITFFV